MGGLQSTRETCRHAMSDALFLLALRSPTPNNRWSIEPGLLLLEKDLLV